MSSARTVLATLKEEHDKMLDQVMSLGHENSTLSNRVGELEALDEEHQKAQSIMRAEAMKRDVELVELHSKKGRKQTGVWLIRAAIRRLVSDEAIAKPVLHQWFKKCMLGRHQEASAKWRQEEESLGTQVEMVKDALKSLVTQEFTDQQTVNHLAIRCQELEHQVAVEQSCNFGLGARVHALEHTVTEPKIASVQAPSVSAGLADKYGAAMTGLGMVPPPPALIPSPALATPGLSPTQIRTRLVHGHHLHTESLP
eukprot:TRINITY_DN20468_c0_g1_i1.p1 TRINITY_DN20468_c0_g1~~TRINITY_DN20468_c0_g1_i1.p1  ORF type:complete len:255 (+),score=60.47 TRINITY_DN20468_c0_g1_i1:511-1275(+)